MPDIEIDRITHIKIFDREEGSIVPIYADLTSGIESGSLLLSEILVSDVFEVGQVNASRFEVTLHDIDNVANKEIEVWQTDSNGDNITPLFVGKIDSCTYHKYGQTYEIVAYDYMYYYGKYDVSAIVSETARTMLFEIVLGGTNKFSDFFKLLMENIADAINLPLKYDTTSVYTSSFKDMYESNILRGSDYYGQIVLNCPAEITLNELFRQLGEAQHGFIRFNRKGELVFIPLSAFATPETADVIESYDTGNSEFDNSLYTPPKKIYAYNLGGTLKETGTSSMTYANGSLSVSGNLFVSAAYDGGVANYHYASTLNTLLSNMLRFSYVSVQLIISDTSYNLGDIVFFEYEDEVYGTPIFEMELSGSLLIEQLLLGLNPNNNTDNRDLTAEAVVKVSKQTQDNITAIETAQATATSAQATAETAQSTATSAQSTATSAQSTANSASTTATAAQQATTLLNQRLNQTDQNLEDVEDLATTAKSTADTAKSTAESASAAASSAQTTATTADTKATQASATATAADGKAEEAKGLATTANTTANTAAANASTALTNAEAAQYQAGQAATTANQAKNTANTANTNATEAKTAAAEAQEAANEAQEAINKLPKGGRNLLLRSNLGGSFYDVTAYNCAIYNISLFGNLVEGQKYTLTINFLVSPERRSIRCYVGTGSTNPVSEWESFSSSVPSHHTYNWTFTATEDMTEAQQKVYVYCSSQTTGGSTGLAGTCTVSRIQLEIGDKSTEYSIAPEDILGEINGLKDRSIYKTQVEISQGVYATYYHNKYNIEDSDYILYLNPERGIGISHNYNGGNIVFDYGVTTEGEAILKSIYAQTINADYITAGVLSSQNGKVKYDLDNGILATTGIDARTKSDEIELGYNNDGVAEINPTEQLPNFIYPQFSSSSGKNKIEIRASTALDNVMQVLTYDVNLGDTENPEEHYYGFNYNASTNEIIIHPWLSSRLKTLHEALGREYYLYLTYIYSDTEKPITVTASELTDGYLKITNSSDGSVKSMLTSQSIGVLISTTEEQAQTPKPQRENFESYVAYLLALIGWVLAEYVTPFNAVGVAFVDSLSAFPTREKGAVLKTDGLHIYHVGKDNNNEDHNFDRTIGEDYILALEEKLDAFDSSFDILDERTADTDWEVANITNSGFTLAESTLPVNYRKVGKVVYVTGRIETTTPTPPKDGDYYIILTLPEGYRPPRNLYMVCPSTGGNTWSISVTPSGNLRLSGFSGTIATGTEARFNISFLID